MTLLGHLSRCKCRKKQRRTRIYVLLSYYPVISLFRESYAVAIYEDLIWVIGGEVGEDREKTAIPDVYSTDDTIEQWTAKRRLSRGRASLGVVVFNDSLYAVGGRGEDESKCFDRLNGVVSAFSLEHKIEKPAEQ